MIERAAAWTIVQDHVRDHGLRRHMLAAEQALRWYAPQLGGDPEVWGLAGLLHDYDWEIHPDAIRHPVEGIPLLRANGVPEEVLHAILAHNPTAGTGPENALDHALRACDEITGLIIAATLVRPARDIRQLTAKSVQRNWKDKLFCAAVDRQEIAENVEAFSHHCYGGKLELWAHVANVITALQEIAPDLELDGRLAAPRPPAEAPA